MRAAKLESARAMLRHHQEKKQVKNEKPNDENSIGNGATTFDDMEVKDKTKTVDIVELKQPIPAPEVSPQLPNNKDQYEYKLKLDEQLKAVEILTSNKRYLEMQVQDLQNKVCHIEGSYAEALHNLNHYKNNQELIDRELFKLKETINNLTQDLLTKDHQLKEQSTLISSITDKNNDLIEQLEITRTALVSKETENASLHSQLNQLHSELDLTQLHLQQLSNGGSVKTNPTTDRNIEEEYTALLERFSNLENKLKHVVNEKEQIKVHYEQYASNLNEQLNSVSKQHSELLQMNNELRDREYGMIEQMSQTEIVIQQLRNSVANNSTETQQQQTNDEYENLKKKYDELEGRLKVIEKEYEASQEELKQLKNSTLEQTNAPEIETASECSHLQDIDMSKLHADIASDKIAAQMATAQNVQLKKEIEDLKEVYVKMSQDKLELTEKLDAEKFLNRQLTLKLSEIDEKAKDVNTKLKAKDKEMIRILSTYNELENKYLEQSEALHQQKEESSVNNNNVDKDLLNTNASQNNNVDDFTENTELLEKHKNMAFTEESNNALNISIKEGMLKLQDRFLKKMEELAELSDEKHRLEHIITQLQSETDTICEYVALYQQQRGILKKREEERREQLEMFEKERNRMQTQLENLGSIISQFASDKDLEQYFRQGSRQQEVTKIFDIVNNLKTNHLVDPSKQCGDMSSIYHCSWCSGKVIVV